MVDVVFLLIIFFMTTARFASEVRDPLTLPEERGTQRAAAEAGVIVNVHADGTLVVGGNRVTLTDLRRILTDEIARRGGSPTAVAVTLRADRSARAQQVNRVIDVLHDLGLGGAQVATTGSRMPGR